MISPSVILSAATTAFGAAEPKDPYTALLSSHSV